MTTREALDRILDSMPDQRARELLDFAEYLSLREESEAWASFGLAQFAGAYGPDEPEYTEADVRTEIGT